MQVILQGVACVCVWESGAAAFYYVFQGLRLGAKLMNGDYKLVEWEKHLTLQMPSKLYAKEWNTCFSLFGIQ